MNHRYRNKPILISLLAVFFATIGCAAFSNIPFVSTATPYPTYTLAPTYTRVPTYTLVPTYTPLPPTATATPPTWTLNVISATRSTTFGTYYYNSSQNAEFIILKLQYTYNGKDPFEFSPMSLVLQFPSDAKYPGDAYNPSIFQAGDTGNITDFTQYLPSIITMNQGTTRTDTFIWTATVGVITKFILLFPDAEPITVTVSG